MATLFSTIDLSEDARKAIEAISSGAEENSLLSNPLDEISQPAFVDPLTPKEREHYKQLRKTIISLTSSLEYINSILDRPVLSTSDAQNYREYVNQKNSLEAQINALSKVFNAYQERIDTAWREYQSQRGSYYSNADSVLDEFENLVDKFEVFKGKGLGGLAKKQPVVSIKSSREFAENSPSILFTADYVVDEKHVGALICVKEYKKATHYEFFKRNIFKSESKFERFLFIGRQDLETETKQFLPYLKETLGLSSLKDVYVILDDQIKEDRIYEYQVSAARVPTSLSEIDYGVILHSHNLLNVVEPSIDFPSSLDGYAVSLLGSPDLAWVLSLLNDGIQFFGRPVSNIVPVIAQKDPESFVGGRVKIFYPKDLQSILTAKSYVESLFGVKNTFIDLVKSLGGLPQQFIDSLSNNVLLSVDEFAQTFSFDVFRQGLKAASPLFQLVLEIAETRDEQALKELSKLSIELPIDSGVETLGTVTGLTNIFRFLNNTFISLTYAGSDTSFEKLKQIRALIAINRGEEDAVEAAVAEIKKQQESADVPNAAFQKVFGVKAGVAESTAREQTTTAATSNVKGFKSL